MSCCDVYFFNLLSLPLSAYGVCVLLQACVYVSRVLTKYLGALASITGNFSPELQLMFSRSALGTLLHVLLILGHRGAVWARGDPCDSWEKLKLFSFKIQQNVQFEGEKSRAGSVC